MLSPYLRFTATTQPANLQRFIRGIHSPASFPLFWCLFTSGAASVRFRRSDANCRSVAAAAHSPLSCASDIAIMCSMSVSFRLPK